MDICNPVMLKVLFLVLFNLDNLGGALNCYVPIASVYRP